MSYNAEDWIKELELVPHPEGGYFAETYRASEYISQGLPPRFDCSVQGRNLSTAIYFLLKSHQVSHLHRLQGDEVWHFYAGVDLTLHLFGQSAYQAVPLNAAGHFQAVVPAGYWFGATVDLPDAYALVGCTMAPGFDFGDFELLQDSSALLTRFPEQEALIRRLTLESAN